MDRVGSPPGRIVRGAVTGRWLRGPAGPYGRAARRRSSWRWRAISCSRCGCIDVGLSTGDPWGPVSPPSRRAGGKVTAWLFFRRRDVRHGRAPWPGPHRGPAGRAAGRHARGARAGPCAGGYGSVALFLISPVSHPFRVAYGGQPGPVGPAPLGTVRIAACVRRHPKVSAGWNIAARRSRHPKVLPAGWGRYQGSGRAAGPARRPRCGWRHRACPGCGSRAVRPCRAPAPGRGDALVGPARGEQPQHRQFTAGQRLCQASRRHGACLAAGVHERGSLPRRAVLQRTSIASDSEPAVLSLATGDDRFWQPLADAASPVGARRSSLIASR